MLTKTGLSQGVNHSSEKHPRFLKANNRILGDFTDFASKQKDFCQKCKRFLDSDTSLKG